MAEPYNNFFLQHLLSPEFNNFLFVYFFLYLSLIWIHPLILHQSSKLLLRILRCRENLVSFYFPKETSSISLLTCSSLDCCFPMHILTLLYRRKLLQYLLSCNFLVFKNDCLVPQVQLYCNLFNSTLTKICVSSFVQRQIKYCSKHICVFTQFCIE